LRLQTVRRLGIAAARAGSTKVELLDSDSEIVRDRASTFVLDLAGIAPAATPSMNLNIEVKVGYVIDLSDEPRPAGTMRIVSPIAARRATADDMNRSQAQRITGHRAGFEPAAFRLGRRRHTLTAFKAVIAGAGSDQNSLCASKGRYSRTFSVSRCNHYNLRLWVLLVAPTSTPIFADDTRKMTAEGRRALGRTWVLALPGGIEPSVQRDCCDPGWDASFHTRNAEKPWISTVVFRLTTRMLIGIKAVRRSGDPSPHVDDRPRRDTTNARR
jgi:hypothetical protein